MTALMAHDTRFILTLNGGSSSLKFGLATATRPHRRLLRGAVSRIGKKDATLTVNEAETKTGSESVAAPDHTHAVAAVFERLGSYVDPARLAVVAHRIVHGGMNHDASTRITPALLDELRRLVILDPDHLPSELAIVDAVTARAPEVPQVACFDTAFHRTMPRVSRLIAIPAQYEALGVRRYGFHGLSFTFLMEELERVAGLRAARGRTILAHLGAGASLAAVLDGRSIDTTMGFTPTSGVVMATRSGDLDPGVVLWLLRNERANADGIDDLVNRRSGLLGVSGSSGDMRELLAREPNDPRAADAVALFCHQVRKAIGALATTINGVDTLVFSGGIGENAAPVRARIANGLEHLGIQIDPTRNDAGAAVVSTDASRCTVRVIATDEESILERDALRVLGDAEPERAGGA